MWQDLIAAGGMPVRAVCAFCGSPTQGVETSEVVAVELIWQHVQAEHRRFTDRGSAAISLAAMPTTDGGRVAYADMLSNQDAIYVDRMPSASSA